MKNTVASILSRESVALYVARPAASAKATSITLRDRGRGQIHLTVRNGVVVGAMGSEPARYIGLAIDRARHVARYGGRGQAVAS